MDWGWANATSPIVVVIVGFWLKRKADDRAARILAATKAADDAARQKLGVIEQKVDGTLSKAVTDLAAANIAITQMSVDNAAFQGRLMRLLDNPADVSGAKRAIEAEGAPEAGAMSVDWTQKGPTP